MSLPPVLTRDQWLAARAELLAAEKELTRARDLLNARRRRLGMVRIEKSYVFDGPRGQVGLLDLFDALEGVLDADRSCGHGPSGRPGL